jgi:hypothetical protein
MIILPILQPNNDDDLAETKRKLEIAVKGLKDIKSNYDNLLGYIPKCFRGNREVVEQCLKDLGVE